MPLANGYSPRSVSKNIAIERSNGKPEKQAIAIAYSKAREARKEAGNDDTEQTYVQTLQHAQAEENNAIAIGLDLLIKCPPEDIEKIVEITNDENDHSRIYSEILSRYQTGPQNSEEGE